MDQALETTHTILLALHQRDARLARQSPTVNLRDPRRAFLLNVFNKTVAPRLPFTIAKRSRQAQQPTARQTTHRAPTPSSHPAADTSLDDASKPAKRSRKPAASKEVRGARFRHVPSKSTLDRLRRANIRLFLVDEVRIASDITQYVVMGVNGAIYHVHIGLAPECNCPDFIKRNEAGKSSGGPCKHMLFIFTKVLKVEEDDHRWFQIRLLPSELNGLLTSQTHRDPSVLADERVVQQYRSCTTPLLRKPIQGVCPVCFDELKDADISRAEDVISFCFTCGHNFHKVCFDYFNRARQNSTCPVCNKVVQQPANAATNGQAREYMNLREYSAAHPRELTLAEMYTDSLQYISDSNNHTGRRQTYK